MHLIKSEVFVSHLVECYKMLFKTITVECILYWYIFSLNKKYFIAICWILYMMNIFIFDCHLYIFYIWLPFVHLLNIFVIFIFHCHLFNFVYVQYFLYLTAICTFVQHLWIFIFHWHLYICSWWIFLYLNAICTFFIFHCHLLNIIKQHNNY